MRCGNFLPLFTVHSLHSGFIIDSFARLGNKSRDSLAITTTRYLFFYFSLSIITLYIIASVVNWSRAIISNGLVYCKCSRSNDQAAGFVHPRRILLLLVLCFFLTIRPISWATSHTWFYIRRKESRKKTKSQFTVLLTSLLNMCMRYVHGDHKCRCTSFRSSFASEWRRRRSRRRNCLLWNYKELPLG